MSVNSLGPFTFIRMDAAMPNGIPPTLAQQTAVLQRPGVPGSAILQLGIKGEPFELMTIVDVLSPANAVALIRAYTGVVGDRRLELVLGSVSFRSAYETDYIVLRQPLCSVVPLARAVGGLNGGRYLVSANWALLPVHPEN